MPRRTPHPASTLSASVPSPNGRSPSPLRRARWTTSATGASPNTIEASWFARLTFAYRATEIPANGAESRSMMAKTALARRERERTTTTSSTSSRRSAGGRAGVVSGAEGSDVFGWSTVTTLGVRRRVGERSGGRGGALPDPQLPQQTAAPADQPHHARVHQAAHHRVLRELRREWEQPLAQLSHPSLTEDPPGRLEHRALVLDGSGREIEAPARPDVRS